MRIAVTGCSGFIGGGVMRRARHESWDVLGLARRAEGQGVVACDLRAPEEAAKALEGLGVDCVVHAAAAARRDIPDAEAGYANNVASTLNLAHAAIAAGVKRFIFLSSAAVYGRSYDIRPGGESQSAPADWYARSKEAGEQGLKELSSELQVVVLRLPSVLGPGKKSPDVVTDMLRQIDATGAAEVYGSGKSRRQFADIDDVCGLILHCARRMNDERYSVIPAVGAQPLSIARIAEEVVRAAGKGRVIFDRSRGESPDQFIDPAIMRDKTGFDFKISLEESIRKSIKG